MRKIDNIGDEVIQRHTILYLETELVITLKYHVVVELWTIDVSYKDRNIFGVGLAAGVLHIESRNMPFGFVVQDASGAGLDPFRRNDFSSGRCVLYLVEADEIEQIRGQAVPL